MIHGNEQIVFRVRRYDDDKWSVEGPTQNAPFVFDTEDEAIRWRDRLHDVYYDGIVEGRRRQVRQVFSALGVETTTWSEAGCVRVRIEKP